jgi:hypothetical protein
MHAFQVSRQAFVPAADLYSDTAPLRDTAYLRARGQTSTIGNCHTLPCICTRDIAGLCRILTRLLLRAGQEILREPAAWYKEEVLYRTGCWGGGMGEDWEPSELGGSHVAVQSVHATLADITRYWLYLARAIGDVLNDTVARRLLPSGNFIQY